MVAEIIMFHHVQGLTSGVTAIAEEFRAAGHSVTLPDLFDGRTFETLDEGVGWVGEIGRSTIVDRAYAAATQLGPKLVYVGFSLGARPAQGLAQTRPGAQGAILFHGYHPVAEFADHWPAGVAFQAHWMKGDEWCNPEVAEALRNDVEGAELFTYPGSDHLFTDASVDDYDPTASRSAIERALKLLEQLG